MSRKKIRMSAGALPVLWPNSNGELNIERVGVNVPPGLFLRQLQLWPLVRPRKKLRDRFSRSWSLWRSAKWLLNLSPGIASESEFNLWLKRQLEVAEFGLLTLTWVRENAKLERGLDDEMVLRYLIRHTARGGDFESDGVWIRMRDQYDQDRE